MYLLWKSCRTWSLAFKQWCLSRKDSDYRGGFVTSGYTVRRGVEIGPLSFKHRLILSVCDSRTSPPSLAETQPCSPTEYIWCPGVSGSTRPNLQKQVTQPHRSTCKAKRGAEDPQSALWVFQGMSCPCPA